MRVGLTSALALGLFAAFAATEPAQATLTGSAGGNGGSSFRLSCPKGQVLIGVRARHGAYVDQLRGICRNLDAAGNWLGSSVNTSRVAGGSGGSAVTRTCPSGFAISGFSGRSGALIDRLVFRCTKLGANGRLNPNGGSQNLGAIGGNGGSSFSLRSCASNQPARAIYGRAGLFIDRVQLNCTLPTVIHALQVTRLAPSYTGIRGGSGGRPFNLSCSDGEVLVGVNARSGAFVDRLQGVCSRVTSTGAWTGSLRNTSSAGGTGGSSRTRRCPSGFAVSGFSGRRGAYIDRLVLECSRLGGSGAFSSNPSRQNLSAIGGSGGGAFGTTRCSRPARSIVGRAGRYIDRMQIGCENSSPLITRSEVDTILAGAETSLRQNNGTGDVPCDMDLRRSGRLRIEPSNGMWNLSSSTEFSRARDLLGFVVVTNQISWCGGLGTNIVGCAPVPGGHMAVVPFGTGSGGQQLWAHEFGHTRGRSHRNGTGLIMNSSINGGTMVDSNECLAYRK
jgi:hypothetical protein